MRYTREYLTHPATDCSKRVFPVFEFLSTLQTILAGCRLAFGASLTASDCIGKRSYMTQWLSQMGRRSILISTGTTL